MRFSKSVTSVVVSLSLIGSSTAAAAATAPVAQASPWAILSLASGGAPAAAICGTAAAAAAAAQGGPSCVLPQLDVAPPAVAQGAPLPPPAPVFGGFGGIPIPVLAILAAVLAGMALIGFDEDDDVPNSPF